MEFAWNKIDSIDNLELKENIPYLICVENWGGDSSEWHVLLAYWYVEGSSVTLREQDNTPHYHEIDKTGFYIINDCGEDRFEKIYKVNSPNYYATIQLPDANPDDILTIE